ncbi:hypothetical protein KXD93_00550 [Mucilaginibacter sp. BJC16-A38]|uniref:hypothetical protein n=1 Tax=Mucilaginibacter phenanthrenivorans TaxID=1234842 RepID=UPI002157E842|nr:hypothetical protein [Mucilaginibacter phenanthrenivorans]MCR8556107.1 hypothetical protein [Mucilaginibacter phenanthrenivorans]
MKRILFGFVAAMFLFSCSSPVNYKQSSVAYLKKQYPGLTSVDTIKFLKPDSIYSTFHDTPMYRALLRGVNHFANANDTVKVKELYAVIKEKEKAYKNVVTGWDVRLIYKAKNKKGVLKTDTCRFTFDSTLKIVKDLNGVDL